MAYQKPTPEETQAVTDSICAGMAQFQRASIDAKVYVAEHGEEIGGSPAHKVKFKVPHGYTHEGKVKYLYLEYTLWLNKYQSQELDPVAQAELAAYQYYNGKAGILYYLPSFITGRSYEGKNGYTETGAIKKPMFVPDGITAVISAQELAEQEAARQATLDGAPEITDEDTPF